ncbi:hypothetical protein COJ85_08980 [Bacillus sp. AFS076308]|uniref:hypothetical protein n=1 Tax=unclassified Bacillus (in: firmicutes) TaxID=185979 RepID=UPI000BF4C85F|nr:MULTISPECIES: hypothetical protein [unclassified Bacillus (in: firmicutes)]PFO05804.1 hypothetical protein COJ85_08980 [Bacillus sp. AFS076308]PGV54168.1 hypothetical protein COD92_05915 [Bacillus sp. AFS037270]
MENQIREVRVVSLWEVCKLVGLTEEYFKIEDGEVGIRVDGLIKIMEFSDQRNIRISEWIN